MYYIGIDLGGTNVAAGVVEESGRLLSECSEPTPRGAEEVADAIAHAAQQAVNQASLTMDQIESIGVASPGSIDPENGIVEHAFNLKLDHVPLPKMVEARLHRPTCLENDANAAALGEFVAGAGKGSHSLIAVTLGTGVGTGAVLNGKLFTGFNYAGMEAGHMVIRRKGRPCTCGRQGCWETYASATGLIQSVREAMETHPDSALWKFAPSLDAINGKTAFDAAQEGDTVAKAVVKSYWSDLACGLANLINMFQPEILCLGGGVAKQGESLLPPLQTYLDQEEFTRDAKHRTKLCLAELGNNAGIIGSALVSLYR